MPQYKVIIKVLEEHKANFKRTLNSKENLPDHLEKIL